MSDTKPHVLIADDYEDNREMTAALFEAAGFRVSTARDGASALAKAIEENPDVVLMDLSMPFMDGCEATKQLKQNPATAGIPVALLTGHVMGKRSEDAARSGSDMVIAKPCLPPDLEARIRRLLDTKKK